MKILITMAGRGSRFKNEGIEEEKHRLRVRGKPIFNWSLSSLTAFFDEEFVFVTREENDDESFIAKQCKQLSIDQYEIIQLSGVTDGQASTALKADEVINDTESVAIYNIDTYVEEGSITQDDIDGDGHIPVFSVSGEKWSFVERDAGGKVQAVAEKERISDLATVGFYYFDRWKLFKDAYERIGEQTKSEYGEVYVCPLYQWLIDNGYEVTASDVDADSVHVLGTPSDVVLFAPEFAEEHGLEL